MSRKTLKAFLIIMVFSLSISDSLILNNWDYFVHVNGKFNLDIMTLIYSIIIASFLSSCVLFPKNKIKNQLKHLNNLKRYSFLLSNLVKKDITHKYRRSILGVLWSILNPLLMMIIIAAVFEKIFHNNIKYFPIYFLSGTLLFNFNAEATVGAMDSILEASGLIRKAYIPKYIFPLEKCLFALVNALFSFIALMLMVLVLRVPLQWTLLLFWIPITYTFVFSVGLGMILACCNVFFRDIKHLYGSVLITAWMYFTPIFYPVTILPKTVFAIMKFNPLYHFISYFRDLVLNGTMPGLRENAICLIISGFTFLFGLLYFNLKQNKFILHI